MNSENAHRNPAMTPEAFVRLLGQTRASAIVRTPTQAKARLGMEAAVRGGFRIIEFTLSVPGALQLVKEFAQQGDLVVGAGTVLSSHEARQAVEAGAQFLVSPVVDPEVIHAAKDLGVAMMPGCATPSEMLLAHRHGAPLQKLFPGQGIGPVWVKQTLGPLPFLKIVPTSGVTLDNAREYLKSGAFALGFVNSLFDPADIEQNAFDRIETRARRMIAAVTAG